MNASGLNNIRSHTNNSSCSKNAKQWISHELRPAGNNNDGVRWFFIETAINEHCETEKKNVYFMTQIKMNLLQERKMKKGNLLIHFWWFANNGQIIANYNEFKRFQWIDATEFESN